MAYLAKIYVTLKPVVNDPQGLTVLGGLKNLGFTSAEDVRIGKYVEIRVNESDSGKAEAEVNEMCEKLLSNPVIEEYRYELEELAPVN
ncbi:MAG: phosphoribosylformylglycinamidine synthase subunit PurS [Dehalococcoidia bacterium]